MLRRTYLSGLVFALTAFLGCSLRGEPSGEIRLTGASCGSLRSPEISPGAWADVEGGLQQKNLNTVQRAANLFSWQAFLALNWPAGEGRGVPDLGGSIAQQGPRVWETWKETYEVYLDGGVQPLPWNDHQPIPPGCQGVSKRLTRKVKVSDVVDSVLQALPADGSLPADLKDQQGRRLRYEVRLNQKLFEYITSPDATLYNATEQAEAKAVEFPIGSQLIKAAWREIDEEEKLFFHHTNACVCDEDESGTPIDCRPKTMGLAGLHIMTKTESAPQWIWSTFEQVHNVIATDSVVSPLNDPHCPPELCPPNRQTAANLPNQVLRVVPIPSQEPDCSQHDQAVDNVALLNRDIQTAIRRHNSPFQHYQLVGTQWPVPSWVAGTAFDVMPPLLANTTMETFSQNTSSCMGCHAMARTLNPSAFVSADFSFTLNNARGRRADVLCRNVEGSESCSQSMIPPLPPEKPEAHDSESWQEIRDGHAFATRTYELLRPRYIQAKLNCSSCHLNAGRNPDAAWWVGMREKYSKKDALADRINGCFERSMNGRAICSTTDGQDDCDRNPIMRSLIAYMDWITGQFAARYPDRKPGHGFPPLGEKVRGTAGDYDLGRKIYVQKCSFCHNDNGQGRYENDTYFRPALWGPHSFNACAGMAVTDKLARFLRWNMPYTSGGMLTPREATALATYIDAQCRPGKGGIGPNGEICSLSSNCRDSRRVNSGSDEGDSQ